MARRFLTPDTTTPAADGGNGAAAPPASHVVQWHLHGAAAKVAIAGNVVVAVLFFAAVIWRVFFTGTAQEGAAVSPQVEGASAHGAAEGALFSSSASRSSTPPACASPRSGGLGEADLLALPVYVHGSSADEAHHQVGGAEGTTTTVECAVCLGELRDGETGRVLPRCGHRFHAECVDRWFRSHVTCPLCRAVVAADGGSGKSPKVPPGPGV
ncbi:hypothetical protein BDA96_01G403000 [Sorghum bicolor]|uniref:RING-type E3 ubiquitin transferase n=2 Tax=Sorghum bicolor TaxID=4558 RepID=A0A921V1G0_SORBI|nr:E3 ubiquitin-protein ligase EL5 [Sorghum bicolor]EER94887.1 hypothetical protein SORBI_3001G378600 [Sorghum bicolor]KAG0551200.1 hypothetical protein BDA96_01G402900 [Sorghum bicolor]KAG0551201.1 hypothetical protein BDA96_01G403000 [Sorghum bicolor]|eukprot:XP_002467889.1 E3 ubiquitin-protein ligase EL5 [Sorghum bicolor]